MSTKSDNLSKHRNKVERYLLQLESTLVAISHTDNIQELTPECLANVLWLIQDRIADTRTEVDEIYKVAREAMA